MLNNKFAVMTDSACDLPVEMEESSGVDIIPFQIAVDGVNYFERKDFSFDEYYDMLRNCQDIPVTAHITMPRFLEQFEKYDSKGVEQVLYVSINANSSSTFSAAQMAAQNFHEEHPQSKMQIFIVDSHCYSMPYGWQVVEAAKKLQNGADMASVIEWLEDRFARIEIALAAYSLKFMKKSGRISAAAAFAGELLGLKPIISLNDGVSEVKRKVRGDKEVLPALVEHAEKRMDDTFEYMIGGTNSQNIEELAAMCKKKWKVEPTCKFKLGSAVATNTGPDAIAIVFMGEKRRKTGKEN